MTKEFLEGYRSKKDEIIELKNNLRNLGKEDSLVGNDVIMDYRTGYPRPQSIVATDRKKYERIRSRYVERISILEKECNQVEEFIEGIEDSKVRRIFRMHYLEGKSLEEVGRAIHMDRSSVGKKINRHIMKLSHNSHNSHL